MTESALNIFANGVALYLTNTIYPRLVEGLVEQGIPITIEEIMLMTKTPAAARLPVANNISVSTPVTNNSLGNTSAVKTSIKNIDAVENPVEGGCMYQFKRGKNKDRFCGKTVSQNSMYCTGCLKNRFKNVDPGTQPLEECQKDLETTDSTSEPTPIHLSVIPFDESRGLYKDQLHNFIVQQIEPNVIAALGRFSEEDNKLVPLTEEEKTIARNMGLAVMSD